MLGEVFQQRQRVIQDVWARLDAHPAAKGREIDREHPR